MKLRKMVLKFCANLNFLFTENNAPYLERFYMAEQAGFRGVEIGYPDKISKEEVIRLKNETALELVLLNMKLGDKPETQFGSTSLPNLETTFHEYLLDTVSLAKQLNCHKIHLMAGKMSNEPIGKHLDTYVRNLQHAAKILEKENIIGVIEPINKYALPGYFLNNYETAIDVISKVNSPNIKLMIDVFHLQLIRGNVTNTLRELMPIVGHIQIAQVPHRHEPNVPGELNFEYVFEIIKEAGYKGWIGCEYKPKDGTIHGLDWITQFGFQL